MTGGKGTCVTNHVNEHAELSGRWGCDILNGIFTHKVVEYRTWRGRIVGLVRAPAKRLPWETGVEGSNPSPSARVEIITRIRLRGVMKCQR